MKSIRFISFYSGEFPDYFAFFVESCRRNASVDFVIFNDQLEKDEHHSNVLLKKFSRTEFESLVEQKLGFPVNVQRGLKIAEFRPAFGLLFEELLHDADFWGYCDIDQIFGDIRKFVTEDVLETYDVVTTTRHWVAGHFALFRNTPELRRLFMSSPNYREVFQDSSRNWHFEESGLRWDGVERSIAELAERDEPVSIYDLVRHAERTGSIKALFGGKIREHSATNRINYLYDRGTLTDLNTGEEFMYHHLVTVKNFWWFFIPHWRRIPDSYYITERGLKKDAERRFPGNFTWRGCWIANLLRGVAHSIRRKFAP